MKRMNRSLFILGFLMNIIKNYLLFLPGVILCIIGLWSRNCLIIGFCLLGIDIILSFIEQTRIKNTVENSEDPNFAPFAKAMMADDWRREIQKLVDERINIDQENGEA